MLLRLVCVCAFVALYVHGQELCTRPDGGNGTCIKYVQCPDIMERLRGRHKAGLNLTQYTCGFEGLQPKVCCDSCYTPEGNQGKCVHVKQCPHLNNYINSNISSERFYVRNSRCFTGRFDVCCGPPPQFNTEPWDNCQSQMTAFPPDPASECCGYDANSGDKIFGGEDTAIDEYPWTVLLEYNDANKIKTYCGGTLISNRYVLTAAHCITDETKLPINVRLGEYDTRYDKDCVNADCAQPLQVIPIESILVHPSYSSFSRKNDIALIRLARPAIYNEFVRPICLTNSDVLRSVNEGVKLITAGWGRWNRTNNSPIKQKVTLPLVSIEDCQNAVNRTLNPLRLWKHQICAGGEPGKDACKGDSGGPLMLTSDGLLHVLVGLVSFGPENCGKAGVPGVYSNIHSYTMWIRRNIYP